MKQLFLTILIALSFSFVFAQNDKVFFHNGKKVEGSVIKVSEYSVEYKYAGEDAIQLASKYAIEKIVYKSGREEALTPKIEVNGEDDWEKVLVLEDKLQIAGLTRVQDIVSKTALINFHTANTGDRKAMRKLQKEAAALNCPIILITSERETNYTGASGKGFGNLQEKKKAIAYKY